MRLGEPHAAGEVGSDRIQALSRRDVAVSAMRVLTRFGRQGHGPRVRRVIVAFAARYTPKAGIGTVIAIMLSSIQVARIILLPDRVAGVAAALGF